jgi:hypothetical protein
MIRMNTTLQNNTKSVIFQLLNLRWLRQIDMKQYYTNNCRTEIVAWPHPTSEPSFTHSDISELLEITSMSKLLLLCFWKALCYIRYIFIRNYNLEILWVKNSEHLMEENNSSRNGTFSIISQCYVDSFLGPEKMNVTCGKTMCVGTMVRGFIFTGACLHYES